jgi:hypothetical protein
MDSIAKSVREAKNLTELRDALNLYTPSCDYEKLEHVVDMSALPKFCGAAPGDTAGVWSWDKEGVLLNGDRGFYIEKRDPDAIQMQDCGRTTR